MRLLLLHLFFEEIIDGLSAVADIYLFGSRDQIVRVERFVENLSANREAPLDDLLDALRNDLRTELRLPRVGGPIWWLRIEPKSNDKH